MFARSLAVVVLLFAALVAAPVSAATASAQTIWRLLDYIAVDYPEAVVEGAIVNEAEFEEMKEFSASAAQRIAELPDTPERAGLHERATELEQLIADKASGQVIATTARGVAADLIVVYPVPLAPVTPPDVAHGGALYAQHCASCHGATGDADGPLSAGLDPPAIAFTDEGRARERSIFALYQVIEQGLDGTTMASFGHLPPEERWALAFYSGSLAYPATAAAAGEVLWEADPSLRVGFGLDKLVGTTPAALAAEIGEERMHQVVAFLRRNPAATAAEAAGTLALARTRLDEALAAYTRGDRKGATDLALSGYLDGFEPVEALLSAHDKALMIEIEGAMAHLRAGIARGEPVEMVEERIAKLDGLFAEAEAALSGGSSGVASFLAAFTILLREGLEAILIVMAMLAFLNKADRRDLLPFVHGGWIAALVAGAATWGVATWVITISGASRELTEGFGGLFAALMLLWVGIWMHGKSSAEAWQRYIRDNLSRALTRRSGWLLLVIAFVVVYREVFETILFYAAIWNQGNTGSVIAGALTATVALTGIAIVMLRYSRILPIGKFFAYSSAMIAVLAVALIGKGTAALQEAGYLPIVPWPGFPRIELLGMYPTRETILAQVAMVVLLALGFAWNKRAAARAAPAPAATE